MSAPLESSISLNPQNPPPSGGGGGDSNNSDDDRDDKKSPGGAGGEAHDSADLKKSGRRKISIEFIEDKSRRHITFSKRKAGIMKKAYELSTLTGTQVLLLVASETGHVYTFATPKLQPLITKPEGKNLIQSCLNAPDAPSAQNTGQPRLQGVPSGQEASSMPIGSGGYPDQQLPEDDHNQKDSKNFPFPPTDYAAAFPQPYGYGAPPSLHAMQRGPPYGAPPPMHQAYPNAPSPFPNSPAPANFPPYLWQKGAGGPPSASPTPQQQGSMGMPLPSPAPLSQPPQNLQSGGKSM